MRKQLIGHTEPCYSEYTCYTGISDFTPPDIDTVGYRVFLGNGQYFVSSDVGGGKMQWYGFHKEAAGDSPADLSFSNPSCWPRRVTNHFLSHPDYLHVPKWVQFDSHPLACVTVFSCCNVV